METKKAIIPLKDEFDFADVPSWYALCTNSDCPLHGDCLRYLAGSHAPETKETALCVMPRALHDGQCRWFDKTSVITMAVGFQHLYDRVLKHDYTRMRKSITAYLHGSKLYYEYMRGERPLTPEQQRGIQYIVKECGYEWEVVYEHYYKAYRFSNPPV